MKYVPVPSCPIKILGIQNHSSGRLVPVVKESAGAELASGIYYMVPMDPRGVIKPCGPGPVGTDCIRTKSERCCENVGV